MTQLFKLCGYKVGLEIDYGKVKRMPTEKDMDTTEMNNYAYKILKTATPEDIDSFVGLEGSV